MKSKHLKPGDSSCFISQIKQQLFATGDKAGLVDELNISVPAMKRNRDYLDRHNMEQIEYINGLPMIRPVK